MTGYPKWFSKALITWIFFILFISGIFLVPNMLNYRFAIDNTYTLEGLNRILATSAHVFFSYIMIIITGALLFIHVRSGLKKRKNIFSGLFILLSFFILILTGVALFYSSNEMVIGLSSLVHTLVGVFVFGIYIFHLNYKNLRN